MVTIAFNSGTLELTGVDPELFSLPDCCRWDARTACYRAPAFAYRDLVLSLRKAKIDYVDHARCYQNLEAGLRVRREPRPYQTEAVQAWLSARGRGVVVLPTGSGKSQVALMAIADRHRSALVVSPTLELVRQWYDLLRTSFNGPVGVVGGGDYELHPLTVTTYDSAYLHMDHLGARFGMVVYDECHHLVGTAYLLGAELCLAPYRLGLTATPERSDGREDLMDTLIGPVVYRRDISELSGRYLADYETVRLSVELAPSERAEYDAERATYLEFVRQQGLRWKSPQDFGEFLKRAARSQAGQRALIAYWRQREIALAAPAKLDCVEHLLGRHRRDRVLIFTQDNLTAYTISRRFLIPTITHQSRVRERSEILAGFAQGWYGAVVTSKVLNEGVDVPEANVAIVVSGSGSVREHVQRLGRILRPQQGKRAILYELVSANTSETFTSERRRDHEAYR